MGNVVIVTHWLDGDVIPFIRIGKELKKRKHDVTLITHCHFEDAARKAGIDFVPWDSPKEYNQLVEMMKDNKTSDPKKKDYSFEGSMFRQKFENNNIRLREYNIVKNACKSPDTVLLCKNRSSIAAYLVAEKYKLPLATVFMNPFEVSSMLMYEQMEGKNDLDRLNTLRNTVGLNKVESWLQWESSAKMSVALWPKWYNNVNKEWPSDVETVGFPLERGKEAYKREIPEDYANWLEDNPNPIVITGGTTKCIKEDFYKSSIEACGELGQPTVVLTKYKEFLPKNIPSNVVCYDYLPLDSIMSKAGLLIHHGGMGTLAGALTAGVPQLILPCYVDRPYNAEIIKKLGVGDYLYPVNWKADKMAPMIKGLQKDDIRSKCLYYKDKMSTNKGISVAADYVETLMKNDKYVYSINKNFKGYHSNRNARNNSPKNEYVKNHGSLSDKQRLLLLSIKKKNLTK
ncbi:glycosyltransferase [uncultured Eubacterium sp.]|uniref:glycosyltransferase n=1 Tax=uncultured Eubacterium sp. TaxID=165185 RepID=UPI00259A50D0|nr:nucleotide disphospho-sugar-binding domain-containing protein [uncultured Eubacterium sp.]